MKRKAEIKRKMRADDIGLARRAASDIDGITRNLFTVEQRKMLTEARNKLREFLSSISQESV